MSREVHPLEVHVYRRETGHLPLDEWMTGLDERTRARIRRRLDRLGLGQLGDSKPVGRGVSELRLDVGPGYRVYFARQGNRVVVLLCGGDKSTQRADIQTAQHYWHDYLARTP